MMEKGEMGKDEKFRVSFYLIWDYFNGFKRVRKSTYLYIIQW